LRPDAHIRLEVPPPNSPEATSRERLDLLVGLDGTWAAIELKYPRDRYEWVSPIDPVPYQRGSRDAADDSVYSVVNDLARTERWVAAGAADLNLVIVLTNIEMIWRPVAGSEAVDLEFRFPQGVVLSGTRNWGEGRRLKDPIELTGSYVAHWRDYSDLADARPRRQFRYVILRPV
jgi:hypothetical protein